MGIAHLPPNCKRDNSQYIIWRFQGIGPHSLGGKSNYLPVRSSPKSKAVSTASANSEAVLPWNKLVYGMFGDVLRLTPHKMIINSQDTTEWPSIGDVSNFFSKYLASFVLYLV